MPKGVTERQFGGAKDCLIVITLGRVIIHRLPGDDLMPTESLVGNIIEVWDRAKMQEDRQQVWSKEGTEDVRGGCEMRAQVEDDPKRSRYKRETR
jgi:hypothetical protein